MTKNKDLAWFSLDAQINSILKEFKVDLVIDVGANNGQFASRIRNYYDGKILSFEPVKESYENLKNASRGDRNWRTF